jgi:sortase (surface protein transpeptidase)
VTETITPDADFSSYVAQTGEDVVTIVTCRARSIQRPTTSDHRLVVRGVRIP